MQYKKTAKTTLFLAAIFFIILFVMSFSVIKNVARQEIQEKKLQRAVLVPSPQHLGSLQLATRDKRRIYLVNERISLLAYADSKNTPVGGFDVVLTYDPQKFRFISAKNMAPDFQTFTSQKDNAVYASSVKNKDATAAAIFYNSPVVEFIFQPVATGTADFAIQFNRGLTTGSNLLSEQAKDILTDVQNVSVAVGGSLTISKDKSVYLPDKKTSLTLLEIVPFNPNCADCIESATVQLKQGDQKKTITFSAGGVAGTVDLKKQEFGWVLEAAKFGPTSLELNISENRLGKE